LACPLRATSMSAVRPIASHFSVHALYARRRSTTLLQPVPLASIRAEQPVGHIPDPGSVLTPTTRTRLLHVTIHDSPFRRLPYISKRASGFDKPRSLGTREREREREREKERERERKREKERKRERERNIKVSKTH